MDNATHLVTFFYGNTGSQSQLWDRNKITIKDKPATNYQLRELAKDLTHDMRASNFTIEEIK